MNPLTRWHPIKELEEMEHRLTTFFGHSPATPKGGKEEMTVAEWTPFVDITEDEKEYLIKVKKVINHLQVVNGGMSQL